MVIRKRLKISGAGLVFITTTAIDWIPVFANDWAAKCIAEQLKETLVYFNASLAGYVIMPNHLHILLGLPDLMRLSNFMEAFKSLSSRRIKKLCLKQFGDKYGKSKSFQIWMPRFDDIVITSERQFATKLNYMHNNPVKAGLVARAEDWAYSSAIDWLKGKQGIIPIDKEFEWTK